MRAHIGEAFTEWISHSVHFAVNPIPLAEGWCCVMAASEWCRHWSWVEYSVKPVPNLASSESDSTLPLVESAPPSSAKTSLVKDMGFWTGHKGASNPPVRKASQGPTHKGGCWKLTSILFG